jgi:GNAT superfamily N-acetyltransferase
MESTKDEFILSTDRQKIDIDFVHRFLTESYWAKGIPRETVRRSVEGALCFGIYLKEQQVGFARVITDCATFAYLADVFIDPRHRGKGLGKWLMQTIVEHPDLQGLRRFMLATRDAHGLYKTFGFTPFPVTDTWMHIHQPSVYSETL